MLAFYESPRVAAVYNLGGGRANSISMLEAISRLEELYGRKLDVEYVEEPRRGDHVCYISDLSRFRSDHPSSELTVPLDAILADLAREPLPTG